MQGSVRSSRSRGSPNSDHRGTPKPNLLESPSARRFFNPFESPLKSGSLSQPRGESLTNETPHSKHLTPTDADKETEAFVDGKWMPCSQAPKHSPSREEQQHKHCSSSQRRDENLADEPPQSSPFQDTRSLHSSPRRSNAETEILVEGMWIPRSQMNRADPTQPPRRQEQQLSQRSLSQRRDQNLAEQPRRSGQLPGGRSLRSSTDSDDGTEAYVDGKWIPSSQANLTSVRGEIPRTQAAPMQSPSRHERQHSPCSLSQRRDQNVADEPPQSRRLQDARSLHSSSQPGDGESEVTEVLVEGKWMPRSQVNQDAPNKSSTRREQLCSQRSSSQRRDQLSQRSSSQRNDQNLAEDIPGDETEVLLDGRWIPRSQAPAHPSQPREDDETEVLVESRWIPRSQVPSNLFERPPGGQTLSSPIDGASEVLVQGAWVPKTGSVSIKDTTPMPPDSALQASEDSTADTPPRSVRSRQSREKQGSRREQPPAGGSNLSTNHGDEEKAQAKQLGIRLDKASPGSSRQQQPTMVNFLTKNGKIVVMYPSTDRWLQLGQNHEDGTYIKTFFDGAPDDHLGLKLGDVLVAINGCYVEHMNQKEVEGVWLHEKKEKQLLRLEFK